MSSKPVKSTKQLRKFIVFSWGAAFVIALSTIVYYRNVTVGGLVRLQSDQVAAYGLSILNVFSGPLLSIVFYNFQERLEFEARLSKEHALLAICVTTAAILFTLFQFCSPAILGLATQETIADRIGEIDALLSIINTVFVLPLSVIVLSSTRYAES